MNPLPFRIIPCSEWGAKPPRRAIAGAGKPNKALFHHTAGHHPNLDADSGESYAEAVAYARGIQSYHFSEGWADTGQNFLVTRNGYIFEGRHGSLTALKAGKMVVSAHCPGQNDQPGVEIEHNGTESMTPIQRQAAVWLFAWICKAAQIDPKRIYGHRDYFPTSCPGALYTGLQGFREDVATALKPPAPAQSPWYDAYGPKKKPAWFFAALKKHEELLTKP